MQGGKRFSRIAWAAIPTSSSFGFLRPSSKVWQFSLRFFMLKRVLGLKNSSNNMSGNSSNGNWWPAIFFVGGIVVLFMWALEIGPFEKSYPPSPTYYAPVNSGYNPSFGGSEPSKYSNRETCGSHHCSCKVKRSWLDYKGYYTCPECDDPTTYHHN